MLKKMNQRKKDMLVNLHYRPPMWGVESGKTLPFNHVRKKSLESGSYGRRFPEGSGFRMVPTSKVPRENLGGGCAMLGGFLKVFGLRMVPTLKVPRENLGGGSYGRRFPEGSGLRMVPTSKVPRENLGGGCAMLGGFLKVFGLRMVPTSKVPRENPGGGCATLGGFLKVLA